MIVEPKTAAASAPAVARRLELNFVLLTGGEITAKVFTFLVFSHLARTLGPERYGALEFVLAVMVFFTLAVEFGLGHYGTREVVRGNSPARSLLREITGLRLLLAGAAYLILLALVFALHKDSEIKQLLCVFGLSLFGGPFLLQWFFQAHDRMSWVALASILRQGIFAGCLLLFFRPGTPLLWIGVVECASVIAVGLLCMLMIRFGIGTPVGWPSLGSVKQHWGAVLPIGLTELAWASMWYFATVLFGFLFADASLGWFGAAHRVLMALHTFVWLYFFNLLPSIARCTSRPHETLLALMQRSIRFSVWISIYGAFLLTVLSQSLMTLAFGKAFSGAGPNLAILAWMLPVAMLSGHYRFILIAYNQQTRLLWSTTISAVVAVLCGFVLVPEFGAIGAASALLIANTVNFVLVFREVHRRVVHVPFLSELATPVLGLVIAGGLFLTVHNVWLAAGIATLGYGILLIRLHGRDTVLMLKSLRNTEASA